MEPMYSRGNSWVKFDDAIAIVREYLSESTEITGMKDGQFTITKGRFYGLFASTSAAESLIVVAANGAVYVHGRLVEQTEAERERMREVFNRGREGAWDAPVSERFDA